jgi:hypothetical protein
VRRGHHAAAGANAFLGHDDLGRGCAGAERRLIGVVIRAKLPAILGRKRPQANRRKAKRWPRKLPRRAG